jgi:hypothetical protein
VLTFVPRGPSLFNNSAAAVPALLGGGGGGGAAARTGIEIGALKPRPAPTGIPMLLSVSLFTTKPHASHQNGAKMRSRPAGRLALRTTREPKSCFAGHLGDDEAETLTIL